MLIILISALTVQVFKSEKLEKVFRVNQRKVKMNFENMSTPIPKNYKKALVVYSLSEEISNKVYQNTQQTFRMAKIQADFCRVNSKVLATKVNELHQDDLLVIATTELGKLNDYNCIINHIQNGGNAIFLVRSYFTPFNDLIGVKRNEGYLNQQINGFKFEKGLFPGLDQLKINNGKVSNSILAVNLKGKVKVLATAKNRPLIWVNSYGQGKVLYINSTLMRNKVNRGLLLQYISYLPDYFLSTIFNGKIVNIDDFPAPIKPGKDKIIYDQYHINNEMFYKYIWWSDIYNMGEKYNLKYTGLITGIYNLDPTSPLENFNEGDLNNIKYLGRKLSEANGELGIHGYNHNSLALAGELNFAEYGYSPWESQRTMEEGLQKLKKKIEAIYGDINIYTYVPPSNAISKVGKRAVKNVFPELRVYAGLYTGPEEKGVLYQEFGKDPDIAGTYNFPRLSSGYSYNTSTMWDIYNGIAHYGIFNHFIHPDDLLDEERSQGASWREMEKELNKIFKQLQINFSFLKPMTDIEGYVNYRKLENLQVYTYRQEDTIYIHYQNGVAPIHHFLRIRNKEVKEVIGGEYQLIKRYSNNNLYLITGEQPVVKIKLR